MRFALCLLLILAPSLVWANDNSGQLDLSSELPANANSWSKDSFSQQGPSRVKKMIDDLLPEADRKPAAKSDEPKPQATP